MATKLLGRCLKCNGYSFFMYPNGEILCKTCGVLACTSQRLEALSVEPPMQPLDAIDWLRKEFPQAPEDHVINAVTVTEMFFIKRAINKSLLLR